MANKFIQTTDVSLVFLIFDKTNKVAVPNTNLSEIDDDTIIFVDDDRVGKYIYTNGTIYGHEDLNINPIDIPNIKSDISDIAEFIRKHHVDILKHSDKLKTIDEKVTLEVDAITNKLDLIDLDIQIANDFTNMTFNIELNTSDSLAYDDLLPLYDDPNLISASITLTPDFISNYTALILKNKMSYNIDKMLNRAFSVVLNVFPVLLPSMSDNLTNVPNNFYCIPGTLLVHLCSAKIHFNSGGSSGAVEFDLAKTYVANLLTTPFGIFIRFMDTTTTAFTYSLWYYYKMNPMQQLSVYKHVINMLNLNES